MISQGIIWNEVMGRVGWAPNPMSDAFEKENKHMCPVKVEIQTE